MSHSKTHDCIRKLSEVYDLELLSGKEALEFSSAVHTQASLADSKGKKLELESVDLPAGSATIISMLGSFGFNLDNNVAAKGMYQGFELQAVPLQESRGNNRSSISRLMLVMNFGKSLDLRLNIYPEHALHSIGKFLLRLQDIQTGDPQLDPKVMIKAKNEQQAKLLVSHPRVQETLLALFDGTFQAAAVNDLSVRVVAKSAPSPTEFQQIMDRLHQACKALASQS